jgi:YjbE family integral membrane protein
MYAELTALFSVVIVDLVLAGDNALVVGMAAAGLPERDRGKAVMLGIAAAAVLRIVFAVFFSGLLDIVGLTLAGGLLLLWVFSKLAREVIAEWGFHRAPAAGPQSRHPLARPKSLARAFLQIVVADVSMSLDNVFAVAGAARHHFVILVIGLALSVGLTGVAASAIATMLNRFYWISYVGLVIIAWIAFSMIWEGSREVLVGSS